jgi:hypothetical protein
MQVQIEVSAGDGEIGGHCQFFIGPYGEKGTVVADAEAERTAADGLLRANANFPQQVELASSPPRIAPLGTHLFERIGQAGGYRNANFPPTEELFFDLSAEMDGLTLCRKALVNSF